MSNKKNEFKVIFRGVRGSYPVASKDVLKYGGNTSCIEIRINGKLIVLDAGTGIISLGNELVKYHIASGTNEVNREPIELLMLFSHTHTDHIQGFPFFKPAYLATTKIHMYGARCYSMGFNETLEQSMFTPFFPVELGEMAADLDINNLKETEMIILHPGSNEPEIRRINPYDDSDISPDDIVITCMKSYAHPKDGVLIYKISWQGRSVVYATDKESYVGGDSKLTSFARNTDLLIHDCQFSYEDYASLITPKQGFGHSTPEMAVETAKLANAKKLVLFHHDPSYDDNQVANLEENAIKQFQNSIAAYEGLEIDLI